MITKLYIENYKSIERVELELSKINILIGPNGSGKTSILECVEYFKRAFENTNSSSLFNDGYKLSSNVKISPTLFNQIVFQHNGNRRISIAIDLLGSMIDPSIEKVISCRLLIPSFEIVTEEYIEPGRKIPLFILKSDRKITRTLSGVSTDILDINTANAHQIFYYTCYRSEFRKNVQIVKDFYAKYGLQDVRWVPTAEGQYEIIATINDGVDVNLADVGSGLNALFPVVVALAFYPEGSTIFVEHPEMHLHPRLQYELAGFFLDVSKKRSYQLIFETHSEHLLYGLLNAVARDDVKPNDLTIYSTRKERGKSIFEKLKVYDDGSVEGNLQDFLEADIDAFLDYLSA